MTAPALRPYQVQLIGRIDAAIAGGASVVGQAPTGSGKAVVIAEKARRTAGRGQSVLILAHRIEIVEQICAALDRAGVRHGVFAPGHVETDDLVQVGSLGTVAHAHRLARLRDRFDLLILDECHHAVAGTWRRIIESQPRDNRRLFGDA